MENQETAKPNNQPKHILHILLGIIGSVVLLLAVGWIWTQLAVQPDPRISDDARLGTWIRVNDQTSLDLQRILFVKQKLVRVPAYDNKNKLVNAYAEENYTLFGIKLSTYPLNCWDARPGIDGVQKSELEPVGTMHNGVWCDGILF